MTDTETKDVAFDLSKVAALQEENAKMSEALKAINMKAVGACRRIGENVVTSYSLQDVFYDIAQRSREAADLDPSPEPPTLNEALEKYTKTKEEN